MWPTGHTYNYIEDVTHMKVSYRYQKAFKEFIDLEAMRLTIPEVRGLVLFNRDGLSMAVSGVTEEGGDLLATTAAGAWFLLQRGLAAAIGVGNEEVVVSGGGHAMLVLPFRTFLLCAHINPDTPAVRDAVRSYCYVA